MNWTNASFHLSLVSLTNFVWLSSGMPPGPTVRMPSQVFSDAIAMDMAWLHLSSGVALRAVRTALRLEPAFAFND